MLKCCCCCVVDVVVACLDIHAFHWTLVHLDVGPGLRSIIVVVVGSCPRGVWSSEGDPDSMVGICER